MKKKIAANHPKVLDFVRFLGEDIDLARRIQVDIEVGELVVVCTTRYAKDKEADT